MDVDLGRLRADRIRMTSFAGPAPAFRRVVFKLDPVAERAPQRIIDAHRRYFGAEKRDAQREVALGTPGESSQHAALVDLLVASMTSPARNAQQRRSSRWMARSCVMRSPAVSALATFVRRKIRRRPVATSGSIQDSSTPRATRGSKASRVTQQRRHKQQHRPMP